MSQRFRVCLVMYYSKWIVLLEKISLNQAWGTAQQHERQRNQSHCLRARLALFYPPLTIHWPWNSAVRQWLPTLAVIAAHRHFDLSIRQHLDHLQISFCCYDSCCCCFRRLMQQFLASPSHYLLCWLMHLNLFAFVHHLMWAHLWLTCRASYYCRNFSRSHPYWC